MSDSEPARGSLPDLTFSGRQVVQTLAGTSADVHHISGNVDFGGFPSIRSRVEEHALKVVRVRLSTDHNQIERVNNMLTVLSEHLLAVHAAYIHPNIAPGTVVNVTRATKSGPVTLKAILSPWYSKGGILEHVKAHPAVDRITLLTEIGKALEHLHSHGVVHGAIHPLNILIDNDGHAVVTDACIHTLMSQCIFFPSGHFPFTPSAIYQPSEQFCPVTDAFVQPTTSMDVYSFATTAWTMFTEKEPFADLPNFRAIAKVAVEIDLRGHQRLLKPGNMSTELWVILQRCLARDPTLRPTMTVVVDELESLSV